MRIIEHTVHTNTRRAHADAHRHCALWAEFDKWPVIPTLLHHLLYQLNKGKCKDYLLLRKVFLSLQLLGHRFDKSGEANKQQ